MERLIMRGDLLNVAFQFNSLVIQPTTLCNLNCSYCYLPDRSSNNVISSDIVNKIASDLNKIEFKRTLNIIWHSGEPLTCGVEAFEKCLQPFEPLRMERKIRHSIQTNATLIDKAWCDLFLRYDIALGVSIDGPQTLNINRIDWRGQEANSKIIKGITTLKENNVSFGVICVVGVESVHKAKELFDYFCNLGCESVGFSIVEEEGVNKQGLLTFDQNTNVFWSDLLNAWYENPVIGIREFRRAIVWLESETNNKQSQSVVKDILPSIGYNGDIVLVSPEFLGMKSNSKYQTFVVGNIKNSSLLSIIERGLRSPYIQDFVSGMAKCKEECSYFGFCRGGDASNKFFETGDLNVTKTNYCVNTKMNLVNAVIEKL